MDKEILNLLVIILLFAIMISPTKLLSLSMIQKNSSDIAPFLPHITKGSLSGNCSSIKYTIVYSPFVNNTTEILILYSKESYKPLASCYLKGTLTSNLSSITIKPSSFSINLHNHGNGLMPIHIIKSDNNTLVGISFTLSLVTNGITLNKSNISFLIGTLSTRTELPRSIVTSLATSFGIMILAPLAMFSLVRDKRKTFLLLFFLTLTLISIMIESLISIGYSVHLKKVTVLRYVINSTKVKGEAYLAIVNGNAFLRFLKTTSAGLSIEDINSCPSPFCLLNKSYNNTTYYYAGILRKAEEIRKKGSLALYDSYGHLFLYYNKTSETFIELNGSMGYEPPIETNYYIKLFTFPPLVSILVSGAIATLAKIRRRYQ